MPPILSTNGYIGIKKQATFGTPLDPLANMYIKYLSESLNNEQEEIKGVEGGSGRTLIENYKTTHKIAGAISCYARPNVVGFFLDMLLGKDTYTALNAGVTPATHVITAAVPHFFTIERCVDPVTPTLIEQFQDCHVNDLTIEGESSQPLKMTANIIGTLGAIHAASAPSYETNVPIMFFNAPSYKVDGGATVEISKFSIKISNNFDVWFGTTMSPAEIIEKLLTVDVSFTLKFLNATHYKKVYYGAGTANVGTYATGSLQVKAGYGATDAERSIDIEVPNIIHTGAPVNLAGSAAPIFQECVGYGVKVGAAELITAIVKNNFAADYDA
jgi:hypothetical protein